MIKLAVINLKTLLKSIMKIIIAICVVAMIIKFVIIVYHMGRNFDIENFGLQSNIGMIKSNLPISKCFDENNEQDKNSGLKKILVAELAVFAGAEEEIMEKENQEEVLEFESPPEMVAENPETKQETAEEAKNEEGQNQEANLQTAVIEENNKKDVYTDTYKTVQIKNESDYSLTEEMVAPDQKYANNKDIIIYHTHTCESYTPTENSQYVATGNFRTTDLKYSVVRVGEELANQLAGKNYTVIHDKTYHDYPAYTGSYTRSLATIKNLLGTYQTVDAVFDIHRDALRKQ